MRNGRHTTGPTGPARCPSGAPAVTDRRPVPPGVLPRGVQTWIMAGIALGMLAIMFVVGRPGPPARNAPAAAPEQGPSADRVRDYQERLRTLEAQALREAQAAAVAPRAPAAQERGAAEWTGTRPIGGRSEAARVRKPVRQQSRAEPSTGERTAGRGSRQCAASQASSETDARRRRLTTSPMPRLAHRPGPRVLDHRPRRGAVRRRVRWRHPWRGLLVASDARANGGHQHVGPLHRVLEGTLIDTVLTNRLDGSAAAPVNCLVTNAVYSHSGSMC